ncbi:MAG TPA: ABC transporter permease [Thermoplasmata archaeon]|nr:ABC transporter permease [Thermoplasmata archaeon]
MRPRHIAADLKVVVRSYLRNPVALFFSLFFPIILIALFGLIFSGASSVVVPVTVLNLDHDSPASQEFLGALNNTTVVSLSFVSWNESNFASNLGAADDPVGLVIPDGFGADFAAHRPVNVTLYTDPQDASSAGEVTYAVTGVTNAFNLYAANGTAILGVEMRNVGSPVYTYIDYLIPGLIGFTILTSPMFSMVDIAASYRKDGIFRQLSLTPLTRAEWLTSHILWYMGLTFVTAGIMIGAGVVLFGAHVHLTLGIVPFLIVGPLLFVSLGMLAGSVAKTAESAALIGNIITFPMMFLSGTFFPVSGFPPALQAFAHLLPLYYVIDGMNQVMLFTNTARALTDALIVFVIAIAIFLLAVRFFQWRDE